MGEFDFRPMMNKLVKTGKMWKLVVKVRRGGRGGKNTDCINIKDRSCGMFWPISHSLEESDIYCKEARSE